MTYREWTQLSDSQRSDVIKTWDVYSDGYWRGLNQEAVSDFREKYGRDERIRQITGGLWHGGHLIVAVCKTIPWDEMLDLPKYFYGFRVVQLGTETKPDYPHGLRVMADDCTSGIWAMHIPGDGGWSRHHMMTYEALGLPLDLVERFERWIATYNAKFDAPERFDLDAHNTEGRTLAAALKQFVGRDTRVVFAPETKAERYGGCGPDEEIAL